MDPGAIARAISRNEPNGPDVYHLLDPAVSQSQRGFLNWKFGHAWVKRHNFDNKGPLPAHVSKGKPT